MNYFLKRASGLAAVFLAATLISACGGGSSNPEATLPNISLPIQLLTQYQGTWARACDATRLSQGSERAIVMIGSPTANGSAPVSVSINYFNSFDCTGIAAATVNYAPGSMTAAGTKTVGTITAVKALLTDPGGTTTFSGTGATLTNCSAGQPSITIKIGTDVNPFTQCIPVVSPPFIEKLIFSTVVASSIPNTFDTESDYGGNFGTVTDADGYPVAFTTNVADGRYTKQ